jgi:RTX calcium-binding nonapeptide repeat (4 copies)
VPTQWASKGQTINAVTLPGDSLRSDGTFTRTDGTTSGVYDAVFGNDLIMTGSGNDTVILRGGRSFVNLGSGNDVVEDRINESTQYTPTPDHSPQIDDVLVGAAKGEYTDPSQALLKAYASDFVNADTVKYSAAFEPKRLPSGWADGAGAAWFDLINPLYKKQGVEVTTIKTTDYLQAFAKAHEDEFGYLTQSPLEISLINLSNGEAQTDMLVGFERVMLTEGADKVDVSDEMIKRAANDNHLNRMAAA